MCAAVILRTHLGKMHHMYQQPNILVLPLEGDLDVTVVPRLQASLRCRIAEGCRRVIFNLAETTYVDSLGMSFILSTARRLDEVGGRLSLVNVSEPVYRSLCICRLVDFVPVRRQASAPKIPALDPTARPLWQATMRVVPQHLSEVRARIEELLLSRTTLTPAEVSDLTLAGGEALGNAIDHTCAEGVLLTLSIYPDRVVIEVTDCGEGFELAADEEPPRLLSSGVGEVMLERGRGIRLMRMLADTVEIRRKASGTGTVVRLVKMLTPNATSV